MVYRKLLSFSKAGLAVLVAGLAMSVVAVTGTQMAPVGAITGTGSISGLVSYTGRITTTHNVVVFAGRQGAEGPPAYATVRSGPGPYTITNVADDAYLVGAFMDLGDDMGPPEPGEPFGWYDPGGDGTPDSVMVSGGNQVSGIDISLRDPLRYTYLPVILKNYEPAAGPPERGFLMGVAGLIPRNFPNSSPDDWLNLYETLPQTGELLGVYTNWTDSPETAGQIPEVVSTQFGLAERYRFIPLVALGFHRDVPGGGLEPTLSWADPAARALFRQTAVAIAEQYQPAHLALGVEINRFYEFDPAAFDDFVTAYAELYDDIKAVSPHTLVFPIFQLEMTKGGGYLLGGSEEREPQWELLDRFGERLDLATFTTYPFFDHLSPADLPAEYYAEIGVHTSHPPAFTEIGWPSAPLATAPGSEYGGTEAEQALFVRRFFELTTGTHLALALWAFPHDVGAQSNPAMASVSLRHNDGTPKPALTVWNEMVRREKDDRGSNAGRVEFAFSHHPE